MNEPLINKLRGAVNSDVSLQQMWQALHDFKEGGGEQAEAYSTLEKLRSELGPEQEDLLLEVMDVVSGFCNAKDRIW